MVPFLYNKNVSSGEYPICGFRNVVDLSEADAENGLRVVVSGTETVGNDTPGGNLQQVP